MSVRLAEAARRGRASHDTPNRERGVETSGLVRLVERMAARGHAGDVLERLVAAWLRETGRGHRDLSAIVGQIDAWRGVRAQAALRARIDSYARRPSHAGAADESPIVGPARPWRDPTWFARLGRVAAAARWAVAATGWEPTPAARSGHAGVWSRDVVTSPQGYAGRVVPVAHTAMTPTLRPGVYAVQADADDRLEVADGPPIADVLRRLRGGRPLSRAACDRLAPHLAALGQAIDLAHVRVHDDAEADALCRELRANAFALGRHVVFRAGRFRPDTDEGLALLAHELTHVWQQARGRVAGEGLVRDVGLEREAEQAADSVRHARRDRGAALDHMAAMARRGVAQMGVEPAAVFVVTDRVVAYDRDFRARGSWPLTGACPLAAGASWDGGVDVESWSALTSDGVRSIAGGRADDLWFVEPPTATRAGAVQREEPKHADDDADRSELERPHESPEELINRCGDLGRVVGVETIEAAIVCANEVARELNRLYFDTSLPREEHARMGKLFDAAALRVRKLQQAREDYLERMGGGEDASLATKLLVLAFGEQTVGQHLRPRAREQIRGFGVGRLAAATAQLATMAVVDMLMFEGDHLGVLSDAFAAARGEGMHEDDSARAPIDPMRPDADQAPPSLAQPTGGKQVGPPQTRPGPGPTAEPPGPPKGEQVFPKQVMAPIAYKRLVRATVFEKTIGVDPLSVTLIVNAAADLDAQLTAEVGPGTLDQVVVDANSVGRARLHAPAEARATVDATGALEVEGRLFDVFPAAKVTGKLSGHAELSATANAALDVAVRRSGDGKYTLDAEGALGGALAGAVDVRANLDIEVLGKTLWSSEWTLVDGAWETSAELKGGWQAEINEGAAQVSMHLDEGTLDGGQLIDDAFSASMVAQQDGVENPWKCRADGEDIVGDFKDFPWGGANGAPAYPTAAVDEHPANAWYKYVTGTSISRLTGPYRIVPRKGTDSDPDKEGLWRKFLKKRKNDRKSELMDDGMEKGDAENAAKRELESQYHMGWEDLFMVDASWHCHHIHSTNWGGNNERNNLKYLRKTQHYPYTTWSNLNAKAMRTALGLKK